MPIIEKLSPITTPDNPSQKTSFSKLPPHTSTIRRTFGTPYKLAKQIQDYNQTVKNQLKMSLHEDGVTFRGYIRVTVDLSRPVSIKKMGSKKENAVIKQQNGKEAEGSSSPELKVKLKKFDTFSKNLHLTSQTSSEDVISALLSRYKITNHIKKFALYERTQKTKEHYVISRLSYNSRPLLLRLLHGKNSPESSHTFILMENDIDGIQWEQFSNEELMSFLKIIEIEEERSKKEIEKVYGDFRSNC